MTSSRLLRSRKGGSTRSCSQYATTRSTSLAPRTCARCSVRAACSTISSRYCRSRRATPGYECRNQNAARRAALSRDTAGMRVLVTGAAGFIGSHTTEALLARGDEVTGLDNLNDYYDVNLKLARLARL